jgi:hypothetical protein
MKTFREFLYEARNMHGIDSDAHSQWISAAEKAHKETGTLKGLAQQKHNGVDYVLRRKGSYKDGRSRFAITPKGAKQKTEKKRQAAMRTSTNPYYGRKVKKIKARGMEAHHITPLEHSAKLQASMSPEEWKERLKADRKIGVYHGNHSRNIMATLSKNAPEGTPGIRHRKGGAHDLYKQVKDVVSGVGSKESAISHRDLLAAQVKRERRERDKTKKA